MNYMDAHPSPLYSPQYLNLWTAICENKKEKIELFKIIFSFLATHVPKMHSAVIQPCGIIYILKAFFFYSAKK